MTSITPENPPGFVVRTEAQKAAWENGYRLERGIDEGWLHYGSTTAPGSAWIAGLRIDFLRFMPVWSSASLNSLRGVRLCIKVHADSGARLRAMIRKTKLRRC
jgi:hypothetical protein